MRFIIQVMHASLLLLIVNLVEAADFSNQFGMQFSKIKAGCFLMGRDSVHVEGSVRELPMHQVCLDEDFYLGQTEVTQQQWLSVMGFNPSRFIAASNPVERVSWHDLQAFLQTLNRLETRQNYRLPSEAEWEFAARGGSTTAYYFADDARELGMHAWFAGNSGYQSQPVAGKKSNPSGLYDIYGNVREWVADCWNKNYRGAPTDGTAFLNGDCDRRVLRGGYWGSAPRAMRSFFRSSFPALGHNSSNGFRLAKDAD